MSRNPADRSAIEPTDFAPDWALPPGEILHVELKARALTQAELALRSSLSAKHVNQVIKGVVNLSPDVALALERTLGISAEFWLRADAAWRANRTRETGHAKLTQFREWLDRFPVAVLLKNGIVGKSDSIETRIDNLLRFFRVTDPEAFEKVWLQPQVNYKRSQHFSIDPYATALWIRLAESKAEAFAHIVDGYRPEKLAQIISDLPAITRKAMPEAFVDAQRALLQAGVILIYVPEVSNTRICGISRWLPTGHPVVALTNRHKRIDSFWFYLAHEIGHILLHPARATYIDLHDKTVADNKDDRESAADLFAKHLFVPERAQARLATASISDLGALADELNVALDIVAGQYAHLHNKWAAVSKLRRSIDLDDVLSTV